MVTKRITLRNPSGLHARPASEFVFVASQYSSRITIRHVDETDPANAKSIVMLLSLSLNKGDEIELTADGPDEEQAMQAVVELIESGLNE